MASGSVAPATSGGRRKANRRLIEEERDESEQHSGFTCYVAELAKTAEFYEAIGFRAGKQALVSSRR
jgi:hypothetical protein